MLDVIARKCFGREIDRIYCTLSFDTITGEMGRFYLITRKKQCVKIGIYSKLMRVPWVLGRLLFPLLDRFQTSSS